MSASVVAALACAVVAAVGAGVLVGRSIRTPRMDLPAWACTLAALAVALGAQAYGMYRGYGSGTFRAVQFGAQLIAPLWLAWGLAELAAKSVSVRFGAKLVTMALTVVTGVVLITDPLSSTPFGKSWPAASAHYQIIPRTLLSLIAGVTVAAVVIALLFALARLRGDPAWRRPVIPITAAGAGAVIILGLRLTLPAAAYLALCAGCAVLTWFAGVWADKIGLAELHGEVPAVRADRNRRPVAELAGEPADDEAFGAASYGRQADEGGHRRWGEGYGDDDWYRPAGGNQAASRYPPEGGHGHDGGIAMDVLRQGERGYEPDDAGQTGIWQSRAPGNGGFGGDARLGGEPGPGGHAGPGGHSRLGDQAAPGAHAGPAAHAGLGGHAGPAANGGLGSDGGLGRDGGPGDNGRPGESAGLADSARFGLGGAAGLGRDTPRGSNGVLGSGPGPGADASPGGGSAAHAAYAGPAGARAVPDPDADQAATQRLYGLISIYTLAEGAEEDFDTLAGRVVEEVRTAEPDALVYAVHSVPNAGMQRIFYEVYRDRMAFEDHQRQPHIRRFEAERDPYVLATNVIELSMQQMKLSALPGLSPLSGRLPGALRGRAG